MAIEADFSLPAERVIRALEQIMEWRGKPKAIRCDNGRNRRVPWGWLAILFRAR